MISNLPTASIWPARLTLMACMLLSSFAGFSQIHPPGYERELKMREAEKQLSQLDRDSMMVTDTVIVFDPTTYEQTITVVNTNYSLRDFFFIVLGMTDPDILLDGQPHTIIDPKDYGDMVVRLTPAGKIEIVSD